MKKFVIHILISALLLTQINMPKYVYAEVTGKSGSLPAGGTPNLSGGISMTTCFRVCISHETFKEPLNYDKDYPIYVTEQIENEYVDHFPDMDNSFVFVPSSIWVETEFSSLGWYSAGDGKLHYVQDADLDYKLRKSYNISSDPGNLYYKKLEDKLEEILKEKLKEGKLADLSEGKLTDLSEGKWKDVLDDKKAEKFDSPDATKAQNLWSYFFKNYNNESKPLEKKLREYIKAVDYRIATDDEIFENKLKYIDLMITLYAMGNKDQKEFYADEIERFIKYDQIYTKPPLIKIDTVVRVSSPAFEGTYLFLPCVAYLEYVAGITPRNRLVYASSKALDGNQNYNNSGVFGHSGKIIETLVNRSIDDVSDRKRITDYRGTEFKNNCMSWGLSGVIGPAYFLTDSDEVVWRPVTNTTGIMESLIFKDSHVGFIIIDSGALSPPEIPTGKFVVKASDPETTPIEGRQVIGETPLITVTGTMDKYDENDWLLCYKKIGEFEAKYPKIKLNLSVSGDSTETANTGGKLSTSHDVKGNGTWISVDKNWLLNFMLGKNEISFTHDLENFNIPWSTRKEFIYTGNIEIDLSSQLDSFTLLGDPQQDKKIYFNSKEPDPEIFIEYTSGFQGWSEIKSGSPGNEKFDAMAGTPTTRDIYFISGGSEFIVDFQAQYFKDLKATRTYQSLFTGVPSEFMEGDKARSYTVPSPSGASSSDLTVNVSGGNLDISATWKGSIPNDATSVTESGSGSVTATCTAKPNFENYNNAMDQAKQWQSTINKFTISHTAASDGITRKFNNWGANISPSKTEPKTTKKTKKNYRTETYTKSDGSTGTRKIKLPVSATASPGSDGSYTITVRGSVPANIICGPDFDNNMPDIEDTWIQEITYDIFKITRAQVWKIDRSRVDGTVQLLETDEVIATVKRGDPNIFYNRALTETSADGRLRYSLEPQMLDTVVWNEGPRSNKSDGKGKNPAADDKPGGGGHSESYATGIIYTNAGYGNLLDYHVANSSPKDKNTIEYAKFNERRNSENTATVISDYLILQTSSGDQSILYYEEDSSPKMAQDQFGKVEITPQEMWNDNSESACEYMEDEINVGSYNGNFSNPSKKYKGTGDNHHTKTILDNDPANVVSRPSKPTNLMLYESNLDIPDTKPNGEYIMGDSLIYYKHILSDKAPSLIYADSNIPEFGLTGLKFDVGYSPNHSDINNVVVHNPVSSQFAMVMPVDSTMDQRTNSTSVIGGNLAMDSTELVTRLKALHPKQEFIYNGNAEQVSDMGDIINWRKHTSNSNGVTFSRVTGSGKISGTGSFEIKSTSGSNRVDKYVMMTVGLEDRNYSFSGEIKASGLDGYFEVRALDISGKVLDTWKTSKKNNSLLEIKALNFKTPINTSELEVSIVAENNIGASSDWLIADDLTLTLDGGETDPWYPLKYTVYIEGEIPNPDYVPEQVIPNPEYIPSSAGENITFNYTGSYQTYTVPVTGSYTLEVWGAQGGGTYGGKGGYSKGTVSLNKGDTLYIVVGGQGGQTTSSGTSIPGGYNGGGTGHGDWYTAGGGGATHIANRNGQLQSLSSYRSSIMIVAGGGGGQGSNSSSNAGGDGGGTSGGSGSGGWEGGGASQSSGGHSNKYSGSFGKGGNAYGYDMDMDVGGGGGGYYGGGGAGGNSGSSYDAGGGGGSGYIGGVINGNMQSGVHSSHGLAKITSPEIIGNGKPEFITIPAKGSPTIQSSVSIDKAKSQPPDNWYETAVITIPANPTVSIPHMGNVTAGEFITLDYPFQVYFPNKGDFYGDGSYGLSRTTSQRGKGFIDNMDTTEWTKEKFAKFEFEVIHKGVLYLAGEKIELDINEDTFDFYLPLANKEAISAHVEFYTIAINGGALDNKGYVTNRKRYGSKNARHTAFKDYYIDLVGRIGNMVIEDTADFRFANLFKQPKMPTEWIIPNVVKEVDVESQKDYIGSSINIRGEPVTSHTDYLNTYGSLDFLGKKPLKFPLTPSINNNHALIKQPLRIGYPIFLDIQTIGNYYSSLQVIPYYYKLDLDTRTISPVDVYMSVGEELKPINIYGNAKAGWDANSVYHYYIELNWEENRARRNYHTEERLITEKVQAEAYNVTPDGDLVPLPIPTGKNHAYGIAQIMQLDSRNRTFIGTSVTQGMDRNPSNVLNEVQYNEQGQRWHFNLQLPSSAVFVETGQLPTDDNRKNVMNNKSVIISAVDIKSIGDTYVLDYKHPSGNGSVNIAGKDYDLTSIPHNVVAVISAEKSSASDLGTTGTH